MEAMFQGSSPDFGNIMDRLAALEGEINGLMA